VEALSQHHLLDLWERGARLHPLDQGLLALHTALPEVKPEAIADWTLGRRNRALLELHCACFGPSLRAWAACLNCGEKMEFEVEARSLLGTFAEDAHPQPSIVVNDHSFRLPTSRDLVQAARAGDAAQGALRLLQICHVGDHPVDWTTEELEEVGEQFAKADPIAEPRLSLACPVCGEAQEQVFDPVTFLWSELQAIARKLLLEVHALASTYGWTEREILSLSDLRRSLYLQMVRA
jgi:hypothetical protein